MNGSRATEVQIQALAAQQHGLITQRQLLAAGLGEDAIDHRLGNGRLVRLRPGVYALGQRTAAALWGIRPWSGAFVEISKPGRGGIRRRRGRLVHASRHLPAEEITVDLEALLLQLCLDHDLPRPQVNRYDGRRESDFRWPAHGLVVEVDSWTFHGRTRRAFE